MSNTVPSFQNYRPNFPSTATATADTIMKKVRHQLCTWTNKTKTHVEEYKLCWLASMHIFMSDLQVFPLALSFQHTHQKLNNQHLISVVSGCWRVFAELIKGYHRTSPIQTFHLKYKLALDVNHYHVKWCSTSPNLGFCEVYAGVYWFLRYTYITAKRRTFASADAHIEGFLLLPEYSSAR